MAAVFAGGAGVRGNGSGSICADADGVRSIGTVLDPSGLPVEGASVTLTNVGTNYTYTTATSGAGAYQFSRIDAAVYRVTVSADGFRAAVVDNIKLDAATNYSVPPIKLGSGRQDGNDHGGSRGGSGEHDRHGSVQHGGKKAD